jgi:hypothetical protein
MTREVIGELLSDEIGAFFVNATGSSIGPDAKAETVTMWLKRRAASRRKRLIRNR